MDKEPEQPIHAFEIQGWEFMAYNWLDECNGWSRKAGSLPCNLTQGQDLRGTN